MRHWLASGDQQPVACGAREVELHDEVVEVVIAAAANVFPAPGVGAVVPEMGDGRAVGDLVRLAEGPEDIAARIVLIAQAN